MSTATSNRTWLPHEESAGAPPGDQACLEDYERHLRQAIAYSGLDVFNFK